MHARRLSLKRLPGAVILFAFFLVVFFLADCRRPEQTDLIRFIDILERADIAESPFLESEADPKSFLQAHPVLAEVADQWPLLDLGIEQNPFLLKKKPLIGPAEKRL